jgi:hypothetical protein
MTSSSSYSAMHARDTDMLPFERVHVWYQRAVPLFIRNKEFAGLFQRQILAVSKVPQKSALNDLSVRERTTRKKVRGILTLKSAVQKQWQRPANPKARDPGVHSRACDASL